MPCPCQNPNDDPKFVTIIFCAVILLALLIGVCCLCFMKK